MAAKQLLRALRGRRSQLAFSRRHHYRSNVACDWEAGRRFPTAARTLEICAASRIDVLAAFMAFQPAVALTRDAAGQFQLHTWLDALRGTTSVAELAARSGFSRYAWSRWLAGRAEPRLPDFLALVQTISGRVSDLVNQLVPIEQVRELFRDHHRRSAARRLAFDLPWTEAVLRVVETEGYRKLSRHHAGYIAARLGISLELEEQALSGLEAAGILQRRRGRYHDVQALTVDTAAAPEDIRKLKTHWTAVCLARLAAPRPSDWLGYNVISVAASDIERVRDILRGAFREIRTVAAASTPIESVALLNVQLVTWPDDS